MVELYGHIRWNHGGETTSRGGGRTETIYHSRGRWVQLAQVHQIQLGLRSDNSDPMRQMPEGVVLRRPVPKEVSWCVRLAE